MSILGPPPENQPGPLQAPSEGLTPDEQAQLEALQARAADPAPAATESGAAPTAEGVFDYSKAPTLPDVPAGTPHDQVAAILHQFMAEQREWRAGVVKEIRTANAVTAAPIHAASETIDQRTARRKALLASHPYYCAVCGRVSDFLRECTGPLGSNHPPNVVVSTDELQNEPDPLDRGAYEKWQLGHTAAPTHDELLAALR